MHLVIMSQNLLNLISGFDLSELPQDAPVELYRRAVCEFVRDIQPPADVVLSNNGIYLEVRPGYMAPEQGENLRTVRVLDGGRLRRCTPEEEDMLCGFMETVIFPAFEKFRAYVEVHAARERLILEVCDIREKRSLEWLRSLPPIESREAYERECARVGVRPLTDEEIAAMSYGMEYGNYDMDHYLRQWSYQYRLYTLAQRYYQNVLRPILKAKEEERTCSARRAPEMVECPGCHRQVPKRLLMAASFGLVCPDCYDTYSDKPLNS